MSRGAPRFACGSCGTRMHHWVGRCPQCQSWGTVSEDIPRHAAEAPGIGVLTKGRALPTSSLRPTAGETHRVPTGIREIDRVLGGGLVTGSVVLLGGEPGIGKSTLTLQIAAHLGEGAGCLYISGEESEGQIQLRAQRLGVIDAPVILTHTTNVSDVVATLDEHRKARHIGHLVIDSIQTMLLPGVDSPAGTVSQVRGCAHALALACKERNVALWLISHMNKEGQIAGPKVLEHMVDVVLMLEGERTYPFRLLRSFKNRFGGTDEVGVFDMTARGLREVPDPSRLFLSGRQTGQPGTVLFCAVEGSRPVLVEIQALVAPSSYSVPRRATVGCDPARLSMLLAVLEARGGLAFSFHDVYVNVVGGMRIVEPAMDLAVIMALISASTGTVLPSDALALGEVGLTGEIRSITSVENRLREAKRMGVQRIWLPSHERKIVVEPPTRANTPSNSLADQRPVDTAQALESVETAATLGKKKAAPSKSPAAESQPTSPDQAGSLWEGLRLHFVESVLDLRKERSWKRSAAPTTGSTGAPALSTTTATATSLSNGREEQRRSGRKRMPSHRSDHLAPFEPEPLSDTNDDDIV